MKHLKLAALGIALAAASGQASAITLDFGDNWGFNSHVVPFGLIQPIDQITYSGVSYTDSNGNTNQGTTFTDVGHWEAGQLRNDFANINNTGLNESGGYEITAVYNDWKGAYDATVGGNTGFHFTEGTLNVFIDTARNGGTFATDSDSHLGASNPILSLEIVQGDGNVNFNNTAVVDGNVNILLKITAATAGYWFLDQGAGLVDVNTLLLNNTVIELALTDSNNNIILNPSAGIQNDFGNPVRGVGDIYTTNDGSASLGGNNVPEPGLLALLSMGLLGLGAAKRRKI